MPALELNTLEAANIFCGDDPTATSHLAIRSVKFPTMEKSFVDFMPGGGIMGLEIDTHFNKLDVTFSLAGWQPQVMTMIGLWSRAANQFTVYGMLRNRLNGSAIQVKAIAFGMLSRVAPDNFEKGSLNFIEYAIRGLTHYQLEVGGEEIYLWDMANNEMIVGGVDIMADQNAMLGINSAAVSQSAELSNPVTQTVTNVG